jgi:nucleotide-binding universal stress UspA family protein
MRSSMSLGHTVPSPPRPAWHGLGAGSIVVGYNGSALADLALAWAVCEGGWRQRRLLLVYVADWRRPDSFGALSGSAHDLMRLRMSLARLAATSRKRAGVVVATCVLEGAVVDCLCSVADGAEMIVVGEGSPDAAGRGSTARLIEATAPCSTMIIPSRHLERPENPVWTQRNVRAPATTGSRVGATPVPAG